MNTTDRSTLSNMAKHGFSFANDAIFRTRTQGVRCLNRLAKLGLVEQVGDTPEFKITNAGRDCVSHKFTTI